MGTAKLNRSGSEYRARLVTGKDMIKLGASKASSAISALIVPSPSIRSKLGYNLQTGVY